MMYCTVCAHPDKASIEAALLVGEPSLRTLEATYNVSRSALSRHSKENAVSRIQFTDESAATETVAAVDFVALMHHAAQLVEQAEYADPRTHLRQVAINMSRLL